MIPEIKEWRVVIFLLVLSCKLEWIVDGQPQPQVPCFFIFGDSLSDSGNNNDLETAARANYKPYGIDYPDGPTGRFTNGKTIMDVVAEHLGFDHHIPPFRTASGDIILKGVNYASGSAGIFEETGTHLGANVHLTQQIKNHETTITKMVEILGNEEAASNQLKQCLFSVGMGNNDFINNYFLPHIYPTSQHYDLQEYAKALSAEYNTQLKALYGLGARKFMLSGLGKIGCTPYGIITFGAGKVCAEEMNEGSRLFNLEVVDLVDKLNKELPDAKFIFLNNTSIGNGDPFKIGFTNFAAGCCKVREDGQCNPNEEPCINRKEFVFWDHFHPTEVTNILTASRTYTAFDPTDCYPTDVRQLALLQLSSAKV
ncbi:GDSL esterase/lipase At1g29670 [Jatropha curcas]|uniref:GDSL esterase/lipase At1g29670 n=1 Tax=Jatropha curcas TaxID=180498 RepID=UPI0005FAE93A|nr:GDSL esterase/lipase At1g29670 [Jatropha curcas]